MPQWPLAQTTRSIDDLATFNALYGPSIGYDEEFDGSGTSLPSGYSWVNQGTSTFRQELGAGTVVPQAASGDNARMITKSLSGAPSSWTAYGKFSMVCNGTSNNWCGFCLRQSSDGKFLTWIGFNTNAVESWRWSSVTSASSAQVTQQTIYGRGENTFYLRVKKNSSTSWDFGVSGNGITWRTCATAQDPSSFLTPDELAFGMNFSSNSYAEASVHWIRVR